MNREVESASMRPLAKALTKHLDSLRTALRDQCLKNLNLYNDTVSMGSGLMLKVAEQGDNFCESLKHGKFCQSEGIHSHVLLQLNGLCCFFSHRSERLLWSLTNFLQSLNSGEQ